MIDDYKIPPFLRQIIIIGADNPTLKESFAMVNNFIKYFIIRAEVNLFYGIAISRGGIK